MDIFVVTEDALVKKYTFTEVANLEAFEREMDEAYEYWFYNADDADNFLREL